MAMIDIFKAHLRQGVHSKETLIKMANRFYEYKGIKTQEELNEILTLIENHFAQEV